MVGHLLIEQVKDGLVVVKGSQETFELEIQKEPQTVLPSKPSSASPLKSSRSSARPPAPAFTRTTSGVRRTPITSMPRNTQENNEEEEDDNIKMGELVEKLKDLKKNVASDKTNSGLDRERRAARIEQLISKFKSARVGVEESEKLDDMGEQLQGAKKDGKISPSEENEGKVEVDSPEEDIPVEEAEAEEEPEE